MILQNEEWLTNSLKFVVSSCRCVKFRITFLPRAKYSFITVATIPLIVQSELSIPAAIYSLVMFLPAGLMMWYFGRQGEINKNKNI